MVSKHTKLHTAIGAGLITLSILLVFITPPNIAPEFSGTAVMRLSFETTETVASVSEGLASFEHPVAVEPISTQEYTPHHKSIRRYRIHCTENALTTISHMKCLHTNHSLPPSVRN